MRDETLRRIGEIYVRFLRYEAREEFHRRGWSLRDPMGGPDIGDSFSYRILKSQVEILSTYYGMDVLVHRDIPSRRMYWLTQEYKGQSPERFGRKRTIWREGKTPLVVPITQKDGTVVFRTAPLKMKDAWVHPGIARFTFWERAIRKAGPKVLQIIAEEVAWEMTHG